MPCSTSLVAVAASGAAAGDGWRLDQLAQVRVVNLVRQRGKDGCLRLVSWRPCEHRPFQSTYPADDALAAAQAADARQVLGDDGDLFASVEREVVEAVQALVLLGPEHLQVGAAASMQRRVPRDWGHGVIGQLLPMDAAGAKAAALLGRRPVGHRRQAGHGEVEQVARVDDAHHRVARRDPAARRERLERHHALACVRKSSVTTRRRSFLLELPRTRRRPRGVGSRTGHEHQLIFALRQVVRLGDEELVRLRNLSRVSAMTTIISAPSNEGWRARTNTGAAPCQRRRPASASLRSTDEWCRQSLRRAGRACSATDGRTSWTLPACATAAPTSLEHVPRCAPTGSALGCDATMHGSQSTALPDIQVSRTETSRRSDSVCCALRACSALSRASADVNPARNDHVPHAVAKKNKNKRCRRSHYQKKSRVSGQGCGHDAGSGGGGVQRRTMWTASARYSARSIRPSRARSSSTDCVTSLLVLAMTLVAGRHPPKYSRPRQF